MDTIRIFIASSNKHKTIAKAVKSNIEDQNTDVEIWDEGAFQVNEGFINSLISASNISDFALFVFAPDDKIFFDNEEKTTVRDNVLFEYGLFMGKLGPKRCFAIIPDLLNFKIFSDISGISNTKYYYKNNEDFSYYRRATRTASQQITDQIAGIGKRYLKDNEITTDQISNFLGIGSNKKIAIFYHCESVQKYFKWRVDPTPRTLDRSLLTNADDIKCDLIQTNLKLEELQRIASNYDTIFIVDSPPYNELCLDILEHCKTYLNGVKINTKYTKDNGIVKNQIINTADTNTTYSSNKPDDLNEAFGEYEDYFVLMRIPSIPSIIENLSGRLKLIWIVYGIHTKGTHAGLSIFNNKELDKFLKEIDQLYGNYSNKYFELIYKVPEMPTIVNNYTDIKLVHHSKIQLKSEMALQDATPSGLAQYFHENYPLHKISDISIHTIHLDICSACNYNCKTCIESKLRENNKILSIQKISKILCELKKSGCQNINFYGGEPTLHPDFSLINDLVQTMGFSSLLVTNGSYLDNHDVLKSIVKSKNLHIRISIDSFDENTHKINHGIKNGEFTKICKSVEAAIKKITESKSQTSFSISCLLHENIIQNYQEFKKSINNWKEIGVVSFHFRPLLDERKKPILDAIKRNAFPLRQLIQEYPNFVIAPEWLIKLINNSCDGIDDHSTIGNTINYDKCYSCFYRMIISPIYSNSNKDKTTIKLYAKNSTQNADIVNDAWISLCSYRRFNEDTGCIYPEDFYEWLSSGRIDLANKINPKYAFCSDILCCRHEPNNQTYSDISSL